MQVIERAFKKIIIRGIYKNKNTHKNKYIRCGLRNAHEQIEFQRLYSRICMHVTWLNGVSVYDVYICFMKNLQVVKINVGMFI